MSKIKLGIVGCGTATLQYHLPASKLAQNIKVVAVVDKYFEQAKRVSKDYNIPYFFDDYQRIFDLVDGVLIAVPHNLHAPVTIDFLAKRIPVLCEKPMAVSSKYAEEMLIASERFNTPLAIGMMRRFYRSSLLVKRIISNDILGDLRYFDFEEGTVYQWPTASKFYFNKKISGGGVLIDTGVHVLDLLLWWLGNDISNLKYYDDDFGGGCEANCELYLFMNHKNSQIKGRIELSRERKLRNSYRIFGTKGWIEFYPNDSENIELRFFENEKIFTKRYREYIKKNKKRNILYYFAQQLMDFSYVVSGKKGPHVDGRLACQVIKLIEKCYNKKNRIKMPWITHALNFPKS